MSAELVVALDEQPPQVVPDLRAQPVQTAAGVEVPTTPAEERGLHVLALAGQAQVGLRFYRRDVEESGVLLTNMILQ